MREIIEALHASGAETVRVTNFSSIAPGGRRSELLLSTGDKIVCHGEARWDDTHGKSSCGSMIFVDGSFINKYTRTYAYLTLAEGDTLELVKA